MCAIDAYLVRDGGVPAGPRIENGRTLGSHNVLRVNAKTFLIRQTVKWKVYGSCHKHDCRDFSFFTKYSETIRSIELELSGKTHHDPSKFLQQNLAEVVKRSQEVYCKTIQTTLNLSF